MQVVIDANIIVSAMFNKGTAAKFMDQVFAEVYDLVVTKYILDEYDRVLHYPKFPFEEEDIQFVLDWFMKHGIEVEVDDDEAIPFMEARDTSDKKFFWAAKRTGSLLVTGNIRHYPIEEWRTMLWELV